MKLSDILTNTSNQLLESGFARVARMLSGNVPSIDTIGFVTAENPQNVMLSQGENNALMKELLRKLKDWQYGPIALQGKYGNYEHSYLVPNVTRNDIIAIGKDFNQESVIFGKKIGVNHMRFEFIMLGDENEEGPNVEAIGGIRDMVLFNKKDSEMYSAIGKRKKQIDKEGRPIRDAIGNWLTSNIVGRKFVIPFFDDVHDNAQSATIQVPVYEQASLPKDAKTQLLIGKIHSIQHKIREAVEIKAGLGYKKSMLRIAVRNLTEHLKDIGYVDPVWGKIR